MNSCNIHNMVSIHEVPSILDTLKVQKKHIKYSKFMRLQISHTLVALILDFCVLCSISIRSCFSSHWQAAALARCTCPCASWTECVGLRQLLSFRTRLLNFNFGSENHCHQREGLVQSGGRTYKYVQFKIQILKSIQPTCTLL